LGIERGCERQIFNAGAVGMAVVPAYKKTTADGVCCKQKNIRQKKRPPKTPGEPLDGIVMI
jgi:hypothetical protein